MIHSPHSPSCLTFWPESDTCLASAPCCAASGGDHCVSSAPPPARFATLVGDCQAGGGGRADGGEGEDGEGDYSTDGL